MRLREPLQQHHARAFTAHEAIGRSVERLALPLRRKHRACENPMKPPGVIITVTPPASAVVAAARPECVRTPRAPR